MADDRLLRDLGLTREPPPGTPRRHYWFAAPPRSQEDAATIVAHLDEIHALVDTSSEGDEAAPDT